MDLRSKLYHERKEGREEGRKERETELIQSLSKKGKSPEEIADLLDLNIDRVIAVINTAVSKPESKNEPALEE
jgi:predicted transposase YdaD